MVPGEYPRSGSIEGAASAGAIGVPEDTIDSAMDVVLFDQIDSANHQTYRVQLFTSKLYERAHHERLVAQEIFDRPVFLDYEVPYFKVRVGGFADRDDAEQYQQRARAVGYTNAWVVMVNVDVEALTPLYDSLPPDTNQAPDVQGSPVDDD